MSFLGDLNRWADLTERSIDQVVRSVRIQTVELVIEKMPVKTGQAKGSVVAAIGSPSSSTGQIDNSPLNSSDAAKERAASAIDAPSNNIFYLTTTLAYVKKLEDGSSRVQAPRGMFKISAIQLRRRIREAIRNAGN